MDKARGALQFGIRSLNAVDRFNIVTFSTDTRKFRDGLVAASDDNRQAAAQFIERQNASGVTNSGANSINSAGEVVGYAYRYVGGVDRGFRAVRWDSNGSVLELANLGLERAVDENPGLWAGVNTYQGQVTHPGVAESQGRVYQELAATL